jgi:hypothetical protein
MTETRRREPEDRATHGPSARRAAPPTDERFEPNAPLAESGIVLPPQWVRDRGLAVGGPLDVEELPDG